MACSFRTPRFKDEASYRNANFSKLFFQEKTFLTDRTEKDIEALIDIVLEMSQHTRYRMWKEILPETVPADAPLAKDDRATPAWNSNEASSLETLPYWSRRATGREKAARVPQNRTKHGWVTGRLERDNKAGTFGTTAGNLKPAVTRDPWVFKIRHFAIRSGVRADCLKLLALEPAFRRRSQITAFLHNKKSSGYFGA